MGARGTAADVIVGSWQLSHTDGARPWQGCGLSERSRGESKAKQPVVTLTAAEEGSHVESLRPPRQQTQPSRNAPGNQQKCSSTRKQPVALTATGEAQDQRRAEVQVGRKGQGWLLPQHQGQPSRQSQQQLPGELGRVLGGGVRTGGKGW